MVASLNDPQNRTRETTYGFVVGIYPVEDYPQLPPGPD